MLEGGRENRRAREGIGSGARCAVEPPKRRWLIWKETARQSRVSTGRKTACLPEETGRPEFELAELLACLADRQIQIVSKFGHMRRLLRHVLCTEKLRGNRTAGPHLVVVPAR